MPFTGSYEHAIDAKHRLSIPSAIRSAMHPERDGDHFYLVPGQRQGTLSMYGNRRFEAMADSRPWGDLPLADEITYDQLFFSLATCIEMDKQGRVVLPERVLSSAGIGREVMITGANDHLDLWNRADYESFVAQHWPTYTDVQEQLARRARQLKESGARSKD